jgi:hypothetical protein
MEEFFRLLIVGVRVLECISSNACVNLLTMDSVFTSTLNWTVLRVWLVVD